MKLNNKGFAISTIMYMIMILAVLLITLTLALLSGRKLILDKLKGEAQNEIYNAYSLTYRETLNILKEEVIEYADSNDINKTSIKIGDFNTSIDNEIIEGYKLSNKYLTVNYNDNVYDTYLGQEKTITDISKPIDNMLDIVDYKIEGNTYQKTYTGKNLWNFENSFTGETRVHNGITFIKVEDGILTNGTSIDQAYTIPYEMIDKLEIGKTYYISTNNELALPTIHYVENGVTKYARYLTMNENITSVLIYFYFYPNVVVDNLLIKMQLEEGTKATEYEPYVGGAASPNPEYPSEIKSVGDGEKYSLDVEHTYMQPGYYQIKINNKLLPTSELFSISFDKIFTEFGINYELEDGTTGSLPIGYSNSRYYFKVEKNKILAGNSNQLGWEQVLQKPIKNFYIYAYGKVENGWDTKPNIILESGYKIPVKVSGKNLFSFNNRTERDFGGAMNTEQRDFLENSIYTKVSSNNYHLTYLDITHEIIDGNSIKIINNGDNLFYGTGVNFKVTPNTTYTVSADYDDTKGIITVGFFDKDGNYLSYKNPATTFTTPEGCEWINIVCAPMISGEYVYFENIQLEYGAEATEYEPYVNELTTNIYLDEPLRKIGNYVDSVDSNNDKLDRSIGQYILNGNESFGYGSTNISDKKRIYIPTLGSKKNDNNDMVTVFCSHYPRKTNTEIYFNKFGCSGYDTNDRSVIYDDNYQTIEDFSTFITNQYNKSTPVTIETILSTSTQTTIELPHIDTSIGASRISIDTKIQPSKVEFTIIEKIKQI